MEHGGVELMVDPQILTLCNPFFDPLKLKAGQERKKENQTEKKRKRIKRREKSVLGGLIGKINEKNKDKIYEISEHDSTLRCRIRLPLRHYIECRLTNAEGKLRSSSFWCLRVLVAELLGFPVKSFFFAVQTAAVLLAIHPPVL